MEMYVSNREFSQIHFDHAHEQCNKIIKSVNGPINFEENGKLLVPRLQNI